MPPSSDAKDERPPAAAQEAPRRRLRTCPHCKGELVAHEGTKDGYYHCNDCGCCLSADGELRDGHPACRPIVQAEAATA
jgi:hypothetical protein